MAAQSNSPAWLDRPVFKDPSKILTIENLLVAVILILAIISRFVILGERVMSHDEVNHVVPSYELYQGRGYRHDPVTHGPFQFHIVALSYFLFGDNDFTSRIPAATFSTAAVAFLIFGFRRYLGRSGALIAGALYLISPYILFYGRYTRNEAFIELIGLLLLYGILRYLEKGEHFAMFLVTLATIMHFIVKETAFIYTAQVLIFLFVIFLVETRRAERGRPEHYDRFLLLMVVAMLLVFVALGIGMAMEPADAGTSTPTVSTGPETPDLSGSPFDLPHIALYFQVAAVLGALGAAIFGILTLAADLGWRRLRQFRSLSLIILIGTLILPMLSPLPVSMLGWNPLDYHTTTGILRTAGFIVLFFIIGAAIGLWWNPMLWLQNALLFYAIFTVFYTTFFTNADGFLTGLVGSLGYWTAQQGVERGSQPMYYYALLQMPVYEFIGIFGTILAAYFGIRYARFSTLPGYAPALAPHFTDPEDIRADEDGYEAARIPSTGDAGDEAPGPQAPRQEPAGTQTPAGEAAAPERAGIPAGAVIYEHPQTDILVLEEDGRAEVDSAALAAEAATAEFYRLPRPLPVLALLIYWSFSSLLAYTVAGERMPWLTVHITMGFLLVAGWGLGYLVDTTDWKQVARPRGLLAVLLFPVLFASTASLLGSLLGTNPPFQGSTLEQLQATNRFIIALLSTGASIYGMVYLMRGWSGHQAARLAAVVFFALMAVLTARAAYKASFVNYDLATEYLVYAHAAPAPKEVFAEIEEISRRTTGGKNIKVAYSSDMLYPYWWYLRDYPNKNWFQTTPTRNLREFPIVVAGEDVFDKIDQVLGDNFYRFDYIRLWWPNQDYYYLTPERVWGMISSPEMRQAVFNIWLNRDYTEFARLHEKPEEAKALTLEDWSPAARMRVYIRKDTVAQIWNYGASPVVTAPQVTDPYEGKLVNLQPVQAFGATGSAPGQFQAPRGLKVAPDGSLYVADSRNHRIQHIGTDGSALHTWGSFADAASGNAGGGTFNEPWDVAIGRDGSVYVSDTWNHRVQKFTADGQFLDMWGTFGQAESPEAFWGPRGLAVDPNGRLYVMDTGNKRVVVFDPDGNFITQFGTPGFDQGQFDEPVGIAIAENGNVYVTDTWNQRVQVFAPSGDGMQFTSLLSWDITGWEGQSLDNKPFIAVSPVNGNVFVTDPERPRVLEFDPQGAFIRGWGDFSTGTDGFGLASGVAVAPDGSVWVSDGSNNFLLQFSNPDQ